MTDEQLRTAARRVLGLVCERIEHSGRSATYGIGKVYDHPFPYCKGIDDAAVAILREEMDRATNENYAAAEAMFPFIPHPNDDPTQTIVIDV